MEKPELISFKICPFVQRSVITMIYKGIDYDITYIDLANKPDWFLEISPFGKVPVLRTKGEVLFESAVINEYLDEINPPSLHPTDPLAKAKNRAWTEFASQLLMTLFHHLKAKEMQESEDHKSALKGMINQLEGVLGGGPYFNGEDFALVDTAFAPFFMRLFIGERLGGESLVEGLPKVKAYGKALMEVDAVRDSVVPDFEELFIEYLKKNGSYLLS